MVAVPSRALTAAWSTASAALAPGTLGQRQHIVPYVCGVVAGPDAAVGVVPADKRAGVNNQTPASGRGGPVVDGPPPASEAPEPPLHNRLSVAEIKHLSAASDGGVVRTAAPRGAPSRRSGDAKCRFCSYKTASLVNLARHERTHTGERPYACTLCSYRSARSDDLAKHIRYGAVEREGGDANA